MIDTMALPEGVYRDAQSGQLMRDVPRFVGFVTADGKPWEEGAGPRFEAHDLVPRPVALAAPTDAEEEIERKRLAAVQRGQDFYHPRLGWLRYGRKRELEWPENLGSGVVRYNRRIQAVPAGDEPEAAGPAEAPAREKKANGPR